jgi:alpha-L-rhamnosidase
VHDWLAEWIWLPGQWETPNITVYARRVLLNFLAKPIEATLWVSADNRYRLWVNGVFVGEDDDFAVAERYDVTRLLKLGRNLLAVQVDNVRRTLAGCCWRCASACPTGRQGG